MKWGDAISKGIGEFKQIYQPLMKIWVGCWLFGLTEPGQGHVLKHVVFGVQHTKKIFNLILNNYFYSSQYLAFEINNKNYYICLHTGHWESSGLIDFLPIEPFPVIQGRVEFVSSTLVEGFFEEEMFVIFE